MIVYALFDLDANEYYDVDQDGIPRQYGKEVNARIRRTQIIGSIERHNKYRSYGQPLVVPNIDIVEIKLERIIK